MNEDNFEGSLVLEKLADFGLVDDFYEAVDSDNILRAISLLRKAEVDEEMIEVVVRKMREGDG